VSYVFTKLRDLRLDTVDLYAILKYLQALAISMQWRYCEWV